MKYMNEMLFYAVRTSNDDGDTHKNKMNAIPQM